MYQSSLSVFMTNKTLVAWKSITKNNTKTENGQNVQVSSSDRLAQYCVTLSLWFTHKTATIYTKQSMTPLLFHNFEVSRRACNYLLKNYGFIWEAIFICMRVHLKDHLEIIIQGRWISNAVCAWDQRTSVWILSSVERGTWKEWWGRSL